MKNGLCFIALSTNQNVPLSGLFAKELGISDGVEPSAHMADLAIQRGIHVCRAVAEELPYHNHVFDFALMVTTICFVDNPQAAIGEMVRIVRPGWRIIIAFVNRASPLGKQYELHQQENVFYRDATFYSAEQVIHLLERENVEIAEIKQTVFGKLDDIQTVQDYEEGFGKGGFVILTAKV